MADHGSGDAKPPQSPNQGPSGTKVPGDEGYGAVFDNPYGDYEGLHSHPPQQPAEGEGRQSPAEDVAPDAPEPPAPDAPATLSEPVAQPSLEPMAPPPDPIATLAVPEPARAEPEPVTQSTPLEPQTPVTAAPQTPAAQAPSGPVPPDAAGEPAVPQAAARNGLACVVLAAGKGTRMKSAKPKVLHEIGHRPMLHHVLAVCETQSPELIVTVVGADAGDVTDAAERFSPRVRTAVQDPPLGTGHAVMATRAELEAHRGDVLVMFADTPLIRPETVEAMRATRASSNAAVVVLGFTPHDPTGYGRLISGRDGSLHAIVEAKDATPDQLAVPLCNAGVMLIDGASLFPLLDQITDQNASGEFYLTDVVAVARQNGRKCYVVEGDPEEVMGVNSRLQLADAEGVFQTRRRAQIMESGVTLLDPFTVYFAWDTYIGTDVVIGQNVIFGPGVTVGNNVEIKAFSHIEGARIGNDAVIGPFARLRPGTELGARVRIGNFVETKKAQIGAGAKVNHLSYMGDVTIGPEANIGAGAITCNYDGFDKFQTEIGAGAFVGTNASLVAPVKVGDGAFTGAGSVITKNVSSNALAVARPNQKEHDQWAARFRERKLMAKAKAAE